MGSGPRETLRRKGDGAGPGIHALGQRSGGRRLEGLCSIVTSISSSISISTSITIL